MFRLPQMPRITSLRNSNRLKVDSLLWPNLSLCAKYYPSFFCISLSKLGKFRSMAEFQRYSSLPKNHSLSYALTSSYIF